MRLIVLILFVGLFLFICEKYPIIPCFLFMTPIGAGIALAIGITIYVQFFWEECEAKARQ